MTAPAYEAVPYSSFPYPAANPDRLAAVGGLNGLELADPAQSRVLELGCGDAGNLLAIAAALPNATCVGIDASPAAIERGTSIARQAGLERVELAVGDLRSLSGELGQYDYVIAHGVLSWVAEPVREALFAAISRHLAPGGLAYVSYHALPGFHLRALARDIARRGSAGAREPSSRAAAARDALALAAELHGQADVYGHVLAIESNRYAERDDSVLFHDELADECAPFAVSDVARRAGVHDLAYLGEALWEDMWEWRQTSVEAGRVRAAAGTDPLDRQQLADDVWGVVFKGTVLAHEATALRAQPRAESVLDLYASQEINATPPERPITPAHQVAAALAAAVPETMRVRQLGREAGLDEKTTASAALRLAAGRQINLYVQPPPRADHAGERPCASPLARVQADAGSQVASLAHETIRLDEFARVLVRLLDGTRDRDAIAADLTSAGRAASASEHAVEQVVSGLDGHLDELARLGLLSNAD